MTIEFSRIEPRLINGWHMLERKRADGKYEIALVDSNENFRHISRGATRELCITGLCNSGYAVPDDLIPKDQL